MKPSCPVKAELWRKRLSEAGKGKKPWNLGVPHTEETREKISRINLGKKRTPEQIEKLRLTVIGRKHSEQTKAMIRESNIGKNSGKFIGEKSPRWNPNKISPRYPLGWNKNFKEQIRSRDEYKCQACGVHEAETMKRHDVHHIDYVKENISPENLVALCKRCHMKTNANREFWTEHFNSKKGLQKC